MKKDEKELEKEQEKMSHEAPEEKEEGHETSKADGDGERAAFDEEKKAYMAEKLEFEAARTLSDEGLPVSFAKLLAGADGEETKDNVALFKKEFMKALEEALSKRLKGNVPKTGGTDIYENDPFLAGFGM